MATLEAKVDHFDADVLVIGGGTAGPLAAYKAKAANPALKVVLLEKANVKRSGAIAIGMDGLNNAVVPGFATPEQYVREITIANDGSSIRRPSSTGGASSFKRTRTAITTSKRSIISAAMCCRRRKAAASKNSLSPASQGAGLDFEPLHGHASVERGRRPNRRRHRRQ